MKKLIPVTKFVSDYSEDELMQFQKEFAPTIERFRRIRHYIWWVFYPIVFAIIIDFIVIAILPEPKDLSDFTVRFVECTTAFLFLLFLACAVFAVFFRYYLDRIECSACHNRVGSQPRDYCPECGSDQLEKKKWSWPKCNSCGKRLKNGKGRYTIRYCTHCGVFLDEKGF